MEKVKYFGRDELKMVLRKAVKDKKYKRYLKTQEGISKLAKIFGYGASSQAQVSRLLNNLRNEVQKKDGYYVLLNQESVHDNRVTMLRKLMRECVNNDSELEKNIRIATLRTKKYYNRKLAVEIREAFGDEIIELTYPNNSRIVIYYKYTEDSAFLKFFNEYKV